MTQEIYKELTEGTVDIVVGTHALVSDGVNFKDLGIAIIDEQHRRASRPIPTAAVVQTMHCNLSLFFAAER